MRYSHIIYIIFSCLLVSCSEEVLIEPPYPAVNRTLLFYLGGDNDLSGEVTLQKQGLLKGWNATTMGTVLVMSDVPHQPPTLQKLVSSHGKNRWETIKTYSNEDSSDPNLLKEVVADMQSVSPSESYGLITFSHATGWLPPGAFLNPLHWHPQTRSLLTDGKKEMDLSNFAQALPNHLFDFIVFDMCFMTGVEAIYPLRNKTQFILASSAEILSPGFSSIYGSSLQKLFKTQADLKGFGEDFFEHFNQLKPPFRSATITLIETKPLDRLAQAVRELNPAPISAEVLSTLQYYDRQEPHLFFDFEDYLKVSASAEQMKNFQNIMNEIVLYKQNTPTLISIFINRHSGLSVYVPRAEVPLINLMYEQTEWKKAITKN